MTVRACFRRRMAQLAGAVAAAAAGLALGAAPAGALPILETADANELANALAEATEDQDVCYGWKVTVYDYGGGADGVDQGSSRGVGTTGTTADCPRWVIFEATVTYTSASSESEDSASFTIRSNIPAAPTSSDLRSTGISEKGLLGSSDDQVVANAALLLPALMAEQGLAEPISLEPNTQALPASDRATGTPGSDWMRKYGAALAVAALTLVGGVGWAAWIVFKEHPFAPAPVQTMSRRKRSRGLRQ